MKRALVLLFAVVMALVVTLPAMAFFGFGYTHAVPDNYGKLYAGFDFGPSDSQFNIDGYLGDMWGIGTSYPYTNLSLMFLGLEAAYVGEYDPVDFEVGAFMESNPLVDWPAVALVDAGFYGDMTIHVVDNDKLTWDLFASVNLGVIGSALALDAEFGFEVNL